MCSILLPLGNRDMMSIRVHFRIKVIKTRLKLVFNTNRKMKNIIGRIFISIIMHPISMHFGQKINFKIALEYFTTIKEQI